VRYKYIHNKYFCINNIHKYTHIYTHNEILLSQKEGNFVVWRKMDGTGVHHYKWNKPDTETQTLHVFSDM
jgi:signal transduction histidine kinase